MDKEQLRKQIYDLELRETVLDSEVVQLQNAYAALGRKGWAASLGGLGSLLALLVPPVGVWAGTAGMASCAALMKKYERAQGDLNAEIDRRKRRRLLTAAESASYDRN